ncbi:MAG: 16S rRNA (guanine(527)-N(7))-methyltransferase RsmG [Clostridia bacterium]|nr:16S rRNA (guanine(527)-N(7))-methyltransferase RsmG [Clostridia bacterium]
MQQFYTFTEHLLEVNVHTNLTAIRDPIGIVDKHYIDSLLATNLIPEGARVLDLGCGPGFPSTPLAIMRPDLKITALDSTAKKIDFVQKSTEILQLSNLKAISGRAEDLKLRKTLGKYDVVVSRAVSRLNILCELCLPYLKVGGTLIALKGAKFEEELTEAANAIKVLGGEVIKIEQKQLATAENTTETRGMIVIQLKKEPPPQYPRAYAAILKKPL